MPSEERVMRAREVLPREDWQWLADQLRAWPVKRVHPDRTMCEAVLRPMAADVIETALAEGSGIGELREACEDWLPIEQASEEVMMGNRVLLWDGFYVFEGFNNWSFDGKHRHDCWVTAEGLSPRPHVTHFRPLPAPPDIDRSGLAREVNDD